MKNIKILSWARVYNIINMYKNKMKSVSQNALVVRWEGEQLKKYIM